MTNEGQVIGCQWCYHHASYAAEWFSIRNADQFHQWHMNKIGSRIETFLRNGSILCFVADDEHDVVHDGDHHHRDDDHDAVDIADHDDHMHDHDILVIMMFMITVMITMMKMIMFMMIMSRMMRSTMLFMMVMAMNTMAITTLTGITAIATAAMASALL